VAGLVLSEYLNSAKSRETAPGRAREKTKSGHGKNARLFGNNLEYLYFMG
jgi:hypothetical protein